MRDAPALARLAALAALASFACAGRGGPRAEGRAPLACPHDAIAAGGGCRCAPGLFVLEGACVGAREVEAYCGASPGAARGAGGCGAPVCAGGDAVDPVSGICAPARAARDLLARVRPVPDDLAPGCHDGRVLVVHQERDDGYVACLPVADLCPRTTAWDPVASRCAPVAACAPGEVRGEPRRGAEVGDAEGPGDRGAAVPGACVPVVARGEGERGGARGPIVDIGRWSRAMLGADGGEGTARLCGPLAERPWELDVGPGGARTLALDVELRFPDNDVTQVSGRVDARDGPSQVLASSGAARGAQRALDTLLVPLRALGGVSDAASASIRVRCTVRGGGSPVLLPRPSAP